VIVFLGFELVLLKPSLTILTLFSFLFTLLLSIITNISPFVILLIAHYHRTKSKTGPTGYSLYFAFFLSLVVIIILDFLVLRELPFGRPGSQFAGLMLVFSPLFAIPVMLFGYTVGWVIEWCIRRRNDIYSTEDALWKKALRIHFSKYKKTYIITILLLVAYAALPFDRH
jgi:hypothetical protein